MDQVDSAIQAHGGKALAMLERLSSGNSPQMNEAFREIVSEIIHLRDQLIAARRGGTPCSKELRRTNAILSSAFGIEFPVADAQGTRIREVRDALREMLRKQRAQADPGV